MQIWENFLCFGSFDERIEVKRADVITYRSLLDVLCKNSLLDKAIGLFNKMKDHGVRPDVYIFTMLIDGMCKGGRLKNAKSFSRSFD